MLFGPALTFQCGTLQVPMTVCTPHHEDLSGGGWRDSGPFSDPQAMHTIRPLVECVACCWQKTGCIIRSRSWPWLLLVVMHTWQSQHAYKLYACVGCHLYASVGFRGWYWPSAYLMADNMHHRCLLSLRSSPATMHTCLAVCSSEPLLPACCIHAGVARCIHGLGGRGGKRHKFDWVGHPASFT